MKQSHDNIEQLTQLVLSAQIATLATHSSQFVLLRQSSANSNASNANTSSGNETTAPATASTALARLQSQLSTSSHKQALLLEEVGAISELPYLTKLNVSNFFLKRIHTSKHHQK
jgi:hypothetical protein